MYYVLLYCFSKRNYDFIFSSPGGLFSDLQHTHTHTLGWCSANSRLWDLTAFCRSSNALAFTFTSKTLISLYTLALHNALSVVLRFVCISFKGLYISLRFLSDGERELTTFFQTSRWVDSSTLGSVRVNLFELAYERARAIFNSGEQTLPAEENEGASHVVFSHFLSCCHTCS